MPERGRRRNGVNSPYTIKSGWLGMTSICACVCVRLIQFHYVYMIYNNDVEHDDDDDDVVLCCREYCL